MELFPPLVAGVLIVLIGVLSVVSLVGVAYNWSVIISGRKQFNKIAELEKEVAALKQDVKVLESILIRTTEGQAFRPTRCGFNWENQSATATNLEIKHVGSLSEVTGLQTVAKAAASTVDVYDLKGHLVRKQADAGSVKATLPAGIYIIGGEKVTVK